jgi:hypothetical protein
MIAPEAAASFLRVEPCEMSEEEGGGREEDAAGSRGRERSLVGESGATREKKTLLDSTLERRVTTTKR